MYKSKIIDVSGLIPYGKTPAEVGVLSKNVDAQRFTVILMEIDELKIKSVSLALSELHKIEEISDPELKGMLLAGIGEIQSFYGNYTKAFAAFHKALSLVKSDEATAYVYSAMSDMLRILGYNETTVDILNQAIRYTSNKELHWRLKWKTVLGYKYTEPEKAIDKLSKIIDYYQSVENTLRATRLKKHMANVHVKLKNFELADSLYTEVLETAVELDLPQFQYEILNDRGWLWYQQKEYLQARSLFLKLTQKDLSPYQKSLCLQNLGFVEYDSGNYLEAIKCYSQSLQITLRYEMRNMMFEDYYRLGLCYERVGNLSLSEHFYSLGCDEVMKEIEMKLPVIGYSKKLLDRYLTFLKDNQQITTVRVKEEVFGFTVGKTLKEIRDIFHTHFFNIILSRTKNAPELCRMLQIDSKTYFNYQKKLGLKRGLKTKTQLSRNQYFVSYVESLSRLTWREANSTFKSDLLSFLLEEYQYNKKVLAEVLGISYPYLVNLTSGRD